MVTQPSTTLGTLYDDALIYWCMKSETRKVLSAEEEKEWERKMKIEAKRRSSPRREEVGVSIKMAGAATNQH